MKLNNIPMLSICYITRINFQANKAHVYNTARTCEALSMVPGVIPTLVSVDGSMRSLEARTAFFRKHGVKKEFPIVSLSSLGSRIGGGSRVLNVTKVLLDNLSLATYIVRNRRGIDVVYFRDGRVFLPVCIAKLLGKPVFFEIHAALHSVYSQLLMKILARISDGLVNISYGLDGFYKKYNTNSVVSFCSASDPEMFREVKSKSELRAELHLPTNNIILGYTGNLSVTGNNDSYGIEDIIRALPLLPENIIFIGVGKKGNETEALEKLTDELGVMERVLLLPWVSKEKIAEYVLAFDILIIPSSGAQIGNSPTKMFEYLSAGRPIVAANTEAIAEVLVSGKNSILVDYKDPNSWAGAISGILNDSSLSQKIIEQAKKDAKIYTWEKRGRDIYSFIMATIKK